MSAIKVMKKNLAGEVTYQYEGQVLRHESNLVILEAFFNRPDLPFMDIVLKHGDRFVETFYTDRWYNVFEIYDRDDGKIKGWYCNIGKPAVLEDGAVSYVDLGLDLWVAANGEKRVLDEDEFEKLGLDSKTHKKALAALTELQKAFEKQQPPY